MRSWILVLLLFQSSLLACELRACEATRLFQLMAERLSYMPAVAAYKLERDLPIEDAQRELAVVASARKTALSLNMPPKSAEQFMLAQIEAAKQIQRRDSEAQQQDLTEIRRALITLGQQQLRLLACLQSRGWRPDSQVKVEFMEHMQGVALTAGELEALFEGLK